MGIITLKQKINEILNELFKETGYKYFYGSSSVDTFPYIRYTLGDNFSNRLSNKKKVKNIWYQIDVFSQVPIDVENKNTILFKIELNLENRRLITTDWLETIDEDNNTRYPVYHYFLEVRA